ncbi:MAG: aldo/keto reductase [Bacteroidota bacterium]
MSVPSTLIGLGTAAIGRPQYINIRQQQARTFDYDEFYQRGLSILEQAYRLGIRYFDTAPGYGMAEQLLIDWLKNNELVEAEVATKWGYTYTANFDPTATTHEVKEHSLAKLNEQWQQSQCLLPKLSTYQIHSATFETGVLENQAVLERLFELKTEAQLHIGLTTTGDNQVEVLRKALSIRMNGVDLFDAFQITYNVFDQSTFAMAREIVAKGKRVIVKEALANGRVFPNEAYLHYNATYQKLQALSQKYQVGIDAVALRFCVDSLSPFVVLSGAASIKQLQENLLTATFQLTVEEIASLRALAIPATAYWEERKQLGWN